MAKGTGILVLGAAGRAEEDSGQPRPSGQPPMGSVAIKCQETCKVPIVIVKSTQSPITEDGVRRGARPSCASKNGLNFAVCIDRSNLSRMAFDTALMYAKPQDSIFCLHVGGGEPPLDKKSEANSTTLQHMYRAECDKMVDQRQAHRLGLAGLPQAWPQAWPQA